MVGSSPLARGLRAMCLECPATKRIIPARAGFTAIARLPPVEPADHPRSRGVYRGPARARRRPRGSSPLARGLPADEAATGSRKWIIPARAGFTHRRPVVKDRPADHPRSRGVYICAWRRGSSPIGSSPLARGLLRFRGWTHIMVRIIPARAGFTLSTNGPLRSMTDHPRSRGVYKCMLSILSHDPGSSPLARGLRRCAPMFATRPGIIPARAGFTEGGRNPKMYF